MRTLLAGAFLALSLVSGSAQAHHDHDNKKSYNKKWKTDYSCTALHCVPSWVKRPTAYYQPWYRQGRRFSINISFGRYGFNYGFGYGYGYGGGYGYASGGYHSAYPYPAYRPYDTSAPYGGWSGTTTLPFGGVMYY